MTIGAVSTGPCAEAAGGTRPAAASTTTTTSAPLRALTPDSRRTRLAPSGGAEDSPRPDGVVPATPNARLTGPSITTRLPRPSPHASTHLVHRIAPRRNSRNFWSATGLEDERALGYSTGRPGAEPWA